MSLLEIGADAPAFSLPDHTENLVSLADFSGKWVVVYFYPKASTSGCTVQANAIEENLGQFKDLDVPVLAVSPDAPKKIGKFVTAEALSFPLLGDESKETLEKYGVWQEKSMYGKKYMGVARTTYIVNPEGKIAHVMAKVKPAAHADDVLAWLAENTN